MTVGAVVREGVSHRWLLVLAMLMLPVTLAAQATTVMSAPAVTPADVRFMQEMIGHHQQAVDMTALVASRTRRPQLRVLAERIAVSQADEIAMMRRWLLRHAAADSSHASHQSHAGHDGAAMPGMLSPAQMQSLRAARGARFDRLFLSGMIQHHDGALTMVRQLLDQGGAQESSINRFVTDVDADQRAEISRMQRLRRELR